MPVKKSELEMFVQIRKGGLSPSQAIDLSFAASARIKTRLMQGENLASVVCAEHPKPFFQNLHRLAVVFDFSKAIEICTRLEKGRQDFSRLLIRESVYPLFLLASAWIINSFFIRSVLPSLAVYQESGFGMIYMLQKGLDLLMLTLITVFFVWLAAYPLGLPLSFLKERFERIDCVRQIHTVQFSLLLQELQQAGLSTRQSLKVIASLKKQPFCRQTAKSWQQKISAGMPLEQCILSQKNLDPAWLPFFVCGMESGRLSLLLEGYRKQAEARLCAFFKKAALYIQIVSYLAIGVLVLTVYQAMLSPLNMLNGF
ncbi:MAG: type II secretion system F family protein [Erysipelotrichaceae bacterium]|nr:type II secretion system F family protein [Erysipelotrichaceae bacterium]